MALSLATCSMTFSGTSPSYKVIIDGCQPLHSLPSRFVSFTMDAGAVAHWWKMKSDFWQNELAIGLAKHLAPAVFRFGGTSEDYTLYDFSQSSASAQCELPLPSPTHGCTKLNATQFDAIASSPAPSAGTLSTVPTLAQNATPTPTTGYRMAWRRCCSTPPRWRT
tara:strand:- start:1355 stop:1849 length:495 start_codon:yes stop_codon:yes gene_type:complete